MKSKTKASSKTARVKATKFVPAKQRIHLPSRRYAVLMFYGGLVCLAVSLFISFVYIRPSDFKAQFRQHQLSDCLKTNTSEASCYAHFGHN